jgi:hypothetical protein
MKNADYLEHMTEDDIAMAKRQGYDPTADPSYFIGYQHGRAAGMREAHALIMASNVTTKRNFEK